MTDQIVSRAYIHAKGRAAFLAGQTRDSHAMNWHVAALADWHAGWDEAATNCKRQMNDACHDHKRWPRTSA